MNQKKIVKYITVGVALFAAYKFAQKIFPQLHAAVSSAVKTGQVAYAGQSMPRSDIIDVTPVKVKVQ